MIKAVFYEGNGGLSGFSISGHAGWGESGSDIVCASVSSAAELVCNTLTDFFNENAEVCVRENTIDLKMKGGSGEALKLMKAFRTHLGFISDEFPGCIRIINEREDTKS